MMLLAGLLLTIAIGFAVWVVRARRHQRHDLGAVSAQWLMTNRIQR
jgi:hypothetical protein